MKSAHQAAAFATALSAVGGTFAQDAGPAPGSSGQRPDTLAPVIVTGAPLGSSLFELVAPAAVVSGQGLRLKVQPSLGETLSSEVGVNSTYFGPNSSRPIIRGLDADRIKLLQNGTSVLDASSISPDHAVSLEPILVDRVEVVRGPAALLYGGNAVGGVVNVIDGRIPQEGVAKPVSGVVDLRYDSANIERAGAARVDLGTERFVLHLDGFRRETDDLRIPGDAWTPREQALRGEAGPGGRLPNSDASSWGGAIGGSLLFDRGYAGLAYSVYDTDYGTVAEETVRIKLRQNRWDLAAEVRDLGALVDGVKLKLGHSDYKHREIEDGEVGTTFTNRGYDGRVELAHRPLGAFRGAVGLQVTDFKFSALGEEAFLPSTKTSGVAGFIYEEAPFGPVKLSLGGRIESAKVEASEFESAGLPADSRKFTPKSGSIGLLYAFAQSYGLAFNAAYTERAPTYQELYADGPHLATNAFEVGDRGLDKERSTAFDLALRKRGEGWSGSVGVFYNRFSNFIALSPDVDPATGEVLYRNAEDRADPAVTDPALYADEAIQQYVFRAVPAEFRGIEGQLFLQLLDRGGRTLGLELKADYTRAKNRDTGDALPRIPALRYGGGFVYAAGALGARLDALRYDRQDRTAPGEPATDGFTLVSASVAYRLATGAVSWEAFLRGTNLLDEDARYHTSFLKEVAPLGKRAATVGLRATF